MMSRATLRLLALTVMTLAVSANAHASPIVVDLESFADGDALTNQVPGLAFTNATILTAGISLNEFEFPPASGVNVAFDQGVPVRIDFLNPLAAFGAHITYVVPVVLEAFDAASNSLGIVSSAFASNLALSGDPGSTPNEFLETAFGGMAYVTITGGALGGSFTIDDLVLTPAAVPEPGMPALVLLGMSSVFSRAAWDRRRRRSALWIARSRQASTVLLHH